MNKYALITIIICIVAFATASCGRKGNITKKDGSSYPRIYPTN